MENFLELRCAAAAAAAARTVPLLLLLLPAPHRSCSCCPHHAAPAAAARTTCCCCCCLHHAAVAHAALLVLLLPALHHSCCCCPRCTTPAAAAYATPLLLLLPAPHHSCCCCPHRTTAATACAMLTPPLCGPLSLSIIVVHCCGWLSIVMVGRRHGCGSLSCVTLPIMGTAPSMAKGTTSVEPASGAEKAATAKPEALEPREYGGGGREWVQAGNGCGQGTGMGRERVWAGNRRGAGNRHRAGNRCRAGNGRSFLRWHAGRDFKGGRETASASNGRWVRAWRSVSVGHSRDCPRWQWFNTGSTVVQLGITPVTAVRQLWGESATHKQGGQQ